MHSVRFCLAILPALLGAALPVFEVASVRIHTAAETEASTTVFPGGRMVAINLNARKMLRNAFNVEDYQISEMPRWVDTLNYDIEAKMPSGIVITREDIPELLLSLLEKRFQLQYHRQTAEMTEYALEVDKGGLKNQARYRPRRKLFEHKLQIGNRQPESQKDSNGRPCL